MEAVMKRILAGLLVIFWSVGFAAADDIADKANAAEALAANGKYVEALDALDAAATAVWDKTPLSFRRTLWVAEPPGGFGAYNPRETNVYDSGADMILYAEPIGFGWQKSGDIWKTDIAVDLTIKEKDGKVLFSQKDFQKLVIASRVRNREFMARFTYTLTGIASGEYSAETTLRDAVSGKSGMFALPFVIK
jgi:hypothetical protein